MSDGLSDGEWRLQQDRLARQRLEQEQRAERVRREAAERERYNRTRHLRWPGASGILSMVFGWWLTCVAIYLVIGLPAGGNNMSKPALVFMISRYVLAAAVWIFSTFTQKGGR
jgi:hypothetical protein